MNGNYKVRYHLDELETYIADYYVTKLIHGRQGNPDIMRMKAIYWKDRNTGFTREVAELIIKKLDKFKVKYPYLKIRAWFKEQTDSFILYMRVEGEGDEARKAIYDIMLEDLSFQYIYLYGNAGLDNFINELKTKEPLLVKKDD